MEAARQMALTGDWTTPQFNAAVRLDKPALLYWAVAASRAAFGPSELASRLPSVLGAALSALSVGALLALWLDRGGDADRDADRDGDAGLAAEWAPAAGAGAMLLAPGAAVWGTVATADMLFCGLLAAALAALFAAFACEAGPHTARRREALHLAAAALLALATLAKGPAALLLAAPPAAALGRAGLREVPWAKGAAVFAAVALPWYVQVAWAHPQFVATFFGYHHLERYVSGVNWHGGRPWWYGAAAFLALGFPWSVLVPGALGATVRASFLGFRRRRRTETETETGRERRERLPAFAGAWFAGAFGVFAGSASQLPSYYLPALAPAAVLLGCTAGAAGGLRRFRAWWALQGAALLAAAALLLRAPALVAASADATAAALGRELAGSGPLLAVAAGLAAAGLATLAAATGRRSAGPVVACQGAAMAAVMLGALFPAFRLYDQLQLAPVRALARRIPAAAAAAEPVLAVGARHLPSAVYYRCDLDVGLRGG